MGGSSQPVDPGHLERVSFVNRDDHKMECEYGIFHNHNKLIKIILRKMNQGGVEVEVDGKCQTLKSDFENLKFSIVECEIRYLGWTLQIGRLHRSLTLAINGTPFEHLPQKKGAVTGIFKFNKYNLLHDPVLRSALPHEQ